MKKTESEPLIWKKSGQIVSSLKKPYTFSTLVEDKENMRSGKKIVFFYVYEAPFLKEVVTIFKKFKQHIYEMVKRNGCDRPRLTFMFYKLGIQAQKINLL